MHPEDTVEFWRARSHDELAQTVVALRNRNRELLEQFPYREVMTTRKTIADLYLKGEGVEVGAGDRPWPIASDKVQCFYGDIRDREKLISYFKADNVKVDQMLDAQTFAGVRPESFDFVISAHVIEHLPDPIGSIRQSLNTLKPGGTLLLAVPDMRFTNDRARQPTTLEHLLRDEADGGLSTRREAYEDHVRYVHTLFHPPFSEAQVRVEAEKIDNANMDIHWHAWTGNTFLSMLEAIAPRLRFAILAQIAVQNENIFVLRKEA